MKKISVIIPTHNRAVELKRALTSVYAQSRLPDEVVVVDDGSSDETAQLLAGHFPATRYFYQPNKGVSAARNLGIKKALGEWLAFMDSDDEWLPDKLQRQLRYLRNNPSHRIVHSDEIWVRHGRRVNPKHRHAKSGGMIFRKCLPLCVISPSAVMVHRSLLEDVGLFDESLPVCEDYDLWLRVCARYPVLYVDTPLIIKYGGHADQLSQKYWGMDRFRIQALDKILRSGILSHHDRRAATDMLLEKVEIYVNGAGKRGKHREIARYEDLRQYYSSMHSAAAAHADRLVS